MITEHLYKRLSHKYRDGWRSLDREKFVATVKLTPASSFIYRDELGDAIAYVHHARMPAGLPFKLFRRAAIDTMAGSSCQHEYDCCGCPSYSVKVERIKGRRVAIEVTMTRNY